MEKRKINIKDDETSSMIGFILDNAFGLPVIVTTTPTKDSMKPNTCAKIKDATDLLYFKFADGKCVSIATTEVP